MAVAVPLVTGAVGQALATNLAWSVAANYAISTATFGAIVAVGGMLGAALGAALVAPGLPDVEGPQALEGMGQVSTYGKFIPVVYGRSRLAGNIIWSKGIREVKSTQEVGGKGGGGGQTVTTYTYYCSWALAIGEGKVRDIHNIWFDADLVYVQGGAVNGALSNKLTFYYGDEEQLADPLIEAAEGSGNAPSYRGICYIVFDDVLLTDWGNRIPNITVEISRFPEVGETSNVYPIEMDVDGYNIATSYSSGLIRTIIITTVIPDEALDVSSTMTGGSLRLPLIDYVIPDEALDVSSTMLTSNLRTILLANIIPDEALDVSSTMLTSNLRTILLANIIPDEALDVSSTMTGGSLV